MDETDTQQIREFLTNAPLPVVVHMLIVGELQEGFAAHQALTQVLFVQGAAADPEDAPCRDQSDPEVRKGVIECAFQYPEIRAAVVKLMNELARPPKPWWKFW